MKQLLQKIDARLLPKGLDERYAPYIWLVYLPLFFIPVAVLNENKMDLVWIMAATVAFLGLYFHAFWVKGQSVIYHIVAIILIATLSAFISASATSLFIYGSAFCSRLKPLKYALSVLVAILVWIVLISWIFKFQFYFYVPALVFSLIVGLVNIYQYALHENKQALILSRKETQRLAKVAERERIARDLHDLIGHTFSVITLKADLAGRLLDKDIEKARSEIKQLEDISRNALSQVREVVSGYRTSDLLSELANAKNVFANLDINFDYEFENIDEQQIELEVAANKELAIVLRELVTNIIKHAKADSVTAKLSKQNGNIILSVQDNGVGIDATQKHGNGLKGIAERMQPFNGFLHIQSGAEVAGTLIEISLPALDKD
ncbi:sensor histidine kinase [Paraglaciecola sp. 2405UD69-4]|uniref:sensor histidine kinase n=1 Tax=Paraglaciecola sp. 2405UD69-4 TaxID=3391836 RepID=UPI0039C93C64